MCPNLILDGILMNLLHNRKHRRLRETFLGTFDERLPWFGRKLGDLLNHILVADTYTCK
jgi:hypothetical protein